MATVISVVTGPVKAAGSNRGKRRMLFRGKTRTMIRNLREKLQAIKNRDSRETSRGATLDYSPALVTGEDRTANRTAFDRVISRLTACMAMKEGDE